MSDIRSFPEWQKTNCKGCYYADSKKVGRGEPCCTFAFRLEYSESGRCLKRRKMMS